MQKLTGVIRNYAWGDRDAIAGVLGHEPSGEPEAEYWLGAHPSAPNRLGDGEQSLDQALADDPQGMLGTDVASNFGGLPFLLKLLAAGEPLSIQAHPNLEQARTGFAREDAAGIARDAKHRNYRDANHKPELICAITRFEGKCGFRDVISTRRLVELFGHSLERLDRWLDQPTEAQSTARAVSELLSMPAFDAAELAEAVTQRARALLGGGQDLQGFEREVAWTVRIAESFPSDVGVVVALLLNHVVLEPGQAIFLPAGNLHAYLQGLGVELMANSDNVLRGGLTPKHVDVDELLAVVDWAPRRAPVQTPQGPVHSFDIPVPEFALTRFAASVGAIDSEHEPLGPEIVLVTSGSVEIDTDSGADAISLDSGEALFVGAGDGPYRIKNGAGSSTVAWRASVPSARALP